MNKIKHATAILILATLTITSMLVNITTGLIIHQMSSPDIYQIYSEIIEDIEDPESPFEIVHLSPDKIDPNDLEFYKKKLIEEYLSYRYQIINDKFYMQNILDLNEKPTMDKYKDLLFLPIPSGKLKNLMTQEFKKETMNLVNKGITRTIEIITPPYKRKDLWETRIKLIYRYPEDDEINEKLIEYYKIRIGIDLGIKSKPDKFEDGALMPIFFMYINRFEEIQE